MYIYIYIFVFFFHNLASRWGNSVVTLKLLFAFLHMMDDTVTYGLEIKKVLTPLQPSTHMVTVGLYEWAALGVEM